jgi:hypothetical protein
MLTLAEASDAGPAIASSGLMIREYVLLVVAGGDSLSDTVAVTLPLKAIVGVPLITPAVEMLKPVGNPGADQV